MTSLGSYVCLHLIVNEGKAKNIIDDLKERKLVSGATTMLAKGTAKSEILKLLELHHQRKELAILAIRKDNESLVMDELEKKLNKKNAGIGFSTDVLKISWEDGQAREDEMEDKSNFEALFAIVNRGDGDVVVDIAQKAGAKGATIVHGRGTGATVLGEVFDMVIEPEKDIVLMLIDKNNIDSIMKDITKDMEISMPNRGILFTMAVNRTIGLVK